MSDVNITINMDRHCDECRNIGSTASGLCLRCVTKAMEPKRKMKSESGRRAQIRLGVLLKEMEAK